jgi:hypothetical protein
MRSFAAAPMILLGHVSPRPVALVLAGSASEGDAWLLAWVGSLSGGDAWLLAWVGSLLVLWLLRVVHKAGGLARPLRWPSLPRLRRGRLKIIGVHPVWPTEPLLQATLASQWGEKLTGDARQRAEEEVRGHFARLYLIEVEIAPRTPDFQWSEVTQDPGVPRESWQVPYDERPLDDSGRWAFFFHFLDLEKPLLTPAGPVMLPAPSPTPERLRTIEYDPP